MGLWYPARMSGKVSAKAPALNPSRKSKRGGARRNAGRTSKAEQLGLVELIDRAWPAESREKCFRNLGVMFENGNLEAGKLLLGYAVGKPKEIKEHGGIDGAAIKHEVTVHRVDRPIDSDQ